MQGCPLAIKNIIQRGGTWEAEEPGVCSTSFISNYQKVIRPFFGLGINALSVLPYYSWQVKNNWQRERTSMSVSMYIRECVSAYMLT
jgi:hypothetical protein